MFSTTVSSRSRAGVLSIEWESGGGEWDEERATKGSGRERRRAHAQGGGRRGGDFFGAKEQTTTNAVGRCDGLKKVNHSLDTDAVVLG